MGAFQKMASVLMSSYCDQGHELQEGDRTFELHWRGSGEENHLLARFCHRCLVDSLPPALVPETDVVALAVASEVAARHGFKVSEIREQRRDRKITAARHEAMHELRRMGFSLKFIGYILWREHSTVSDGIASWRRSHVDR